MINDSVFIGAPLSFERMKIYPPTVREVATNDRVFLYYSLLTETQEDMDDKFKDATDENGNPINIPTPFQFLLANVYASDSNESIFKDAFTYFLKEEVTILPEQELIVVGDLEKEVEQMRTISDLRTIRADNFFNFQNCIRQSMGEDPEELPDETEDPRIRRMKAKARYRDRIVAKKKAKEGKSLTLGSKLAAICCMGIGLTPLNIGEISYASVNWLIQYYENKEGYSIGVQSLLAGVSAKGSKGPEHWIRNLK